MSTFQLRCTRSRERGSVLLLAIVILTVIFALGASLIERAQNTVYRASVENRSSQAFELAEAGVQKAVWALSQPNGWLTYDGEQGTALPGGFVNITVTPPSSARDGIQPVTIVASGWIPAPASHPENTQTIRVLSYWEPDTFDFAIFGDQFVELGNGDVDMWNVGDVSEVGTNGTVSDAVAVAPEGVVNGNVVVGFGATAADLCIDNKGVISGDQSVLDMPKFMPPVTYVPAGAVELGDLKITGGVYTLEAGVYHATDLYIGGNGQLACNGKVELYLGSADPMAAEVKPNIGGKGIANTSEIPSNLLIYCLPNVVNVAISGEGVLYGAIYAPNANIDLNSGDVYGSLIGDSVKINGNDCHVYYYEELSEDVDAHAGVRSWEVW